MADKVLKLNIIIDEDGSARRATGELEGNIKRLEAVQGQSQRTAAAHILVTKQQVDQFVAQNRASTQLGASTQTLDQRTQALTRSVLQFGQAAQVIDPRLGGLSRAMMSVSSSGGVAASALVALGIVGVAELAFIKASIEAYTSKTRILAELGSEVEAVRKQWDGLLTASGALLVGSGQHFTGWVGLVSAGLDELSAQILPLIAQFAMLREFLSPSDRDPRGAKPSRFGDVNLPGGRAGFPERTWQRNDPDVDPAKMIADHDRQLQAARAYRIEMQGLEQNLRDVQFASERAFDDEVFASYKQHLVEIKGVTLGIRDDFAAMVLSDRRLQEFRIGEDTKRAISEIDPRASNAGELEAKLRAQEELQMLMLKKDPNGRMSDELVMELRAFQEKWRGIVDDIPVLFDEMVPELGAAAEQIPAAITPKLDAVRDYAMETFSAIGAAFRSSLQLTEEATQMDFDAERNLQQGDRLGIGFLQRKGAASKRKLAADYSRYGLAGGGIVPGYFAGGGFARGSDTVPAMLTPGELVLNIGQQRNVARAISGVTFAPGSIVIQSTGSDVDAKRLADRIQQEVGRLFEAVGG